MLHLRTSSLLPLCKPEGWWHPTYRSGGVLWSSATGLVGRWERQKEDGGRTGRRNVKNISLPQALLWGVTPWGLKGALHFCGSACVCFLCGASCYAGIANGCQLRLFECWECLSNCRVKLFQQFSYSSKNSKILPKVLSIYEAQWYYAACFEEGAWFFQLKWTMHFQGKCITWWKAILKIKWHFCSQWE